MSETMEMPVQAAGPGRRLAQAREAKGLSMEEAAAQLRLHINLLRALESDDYEHLPPAAFVKGYLRSYARMLGLPEHEFVAETVRASEPAIASVSAPDNQQQVHASDPRVRFVTWLVFGGVLLLSMIWWISQETTDAPTGSETEATAPSVDAPLTAPVPVESAGAGGAPATVGESLPVPAEAGGAIPPPSGLAPVPSASIPAPIAAGSAAAVPVPSAPELPVMVAAPAGISAPAQNLPPPLTMAMPQARLTLAYSADCWTEIADAAGRRLIYDLIPSGRNITVRGEAPFSVFLGFSPGVQLTYQGQPYDHRPLQRREMARFKLGNAKDNAPPNEAE